MVFINGSVRHNRTHIAPRLSKGNGIDPHISIDLVFTQPLINAVRPGIVACGGQHLMVIKLVHHITKIMCAKADVGAGIG